MIVVVVVVGVVVMVVVVVVVIEVVRDAVVAPDDDNDDGRLGVKKGINLCLVLLSLSDTLFLVTKTTFRSSKVILTLLYGSEGASRWGRTMVTYHILRKVNCLSVMSLLRMFLTRNTFLTMRIQLSDLACIKYLGLPVSVRCPGAGIMEADERQVTTVFTVHPSFHHRHATN